MATIRPNDLNASTTPTLSTKTLPLPPSTLKTEKSKITAPRIDVEPLYTAVKGAITDADWTMYKTSVGQFLLGNLNQVELSSRLDRILTTPALEHAHNQFILAIFANCLRDAPEPGTASWADDKAIGGKSGAGVGKGAQGGEGEVEKRLKYEVMQLARRERKRLKTVQESPHDAFTALMHETLDAKRIKTPDTGPASAGGFQKTNWELEIRKHYTTPLFTETHEFPDTSAIAARMTPICYENGLPSGHTPECPSLMNTATEAYIKEALTNFFQRVSSNGPGYVRTADFKRRVEKEEHKVDKGELVRTQGGLLPVELEEQRKRRPLCMEDVRLALELGDSYLGQVPIIASTITNGRFLDAVGVEDMVSGEAQTRSSLVNGIVNGVKGKEASADLANGFHVNLGDPMAPEGDWQWSGGSVQDVDGLDSVLDICLAIGV